MRPNVSRVYYMSVCRLRDRRAETETEEDEFILIHHNSETSRNMMDVHLEAARDDDYVFRMNLCFHSCFAPHLRLIICCSAMHVNSPPRSFTRRV